MARREGKPRYIKVKEAILEKINNGHLQVGDKMPGERKVAEELSVSQMTANRAIQELVKEGYLEREMGVGTFVVSKEPIHKISPRVNIVLFGSIGEDEEEDSMSVKAKSLKAAGYSHDYQVTYLTMEYLSKDIFMGTTLRSLMEAGYAYGCEFSFLTVRYPYELENYFEKADRNRESFVLINPLENWKDCIKAIGETGFPIVAISAHWPDMGVNYIDTNNYQGAKMAIEHLYNLGHRKIAVFYAWPETANTQERLKGVYDTMKNLHLEIDTEMFFDIRGIDTDCIRMCTEAIGSMIEKGKPPTAVFAAGFELALAVNSGLRHFNLAIPKDVSLVGFDDSPAGIYIQPPLTTIKQPFQEIAKRAISLLMSKAKDRKSEIIPVELIIRSSTAEILKK